MLIFMTSCSNNISAGFGGSTDEPRLFGGYVALETNQAKYDLESDVNIKFFYGHSGRSANNTTNLLGNRIDVYVTNYISDFENPNELVLLYSIEFNDTDFLIPENECEIEGTKFINITYQFFL